LGRRIHAAAVTDSQTTARGLDPTTQGWRRPVL